MNSSVRVITIQIQQLGEMFLSLSNRQTVQSIFTQAQKNGTLNGGFLLIVNPLPNTLLFDILNGKIYLVTLVLAVYGFCLAPIWALMVTYLQEKLGPLHGANAIGFMVAAAGIGVGILPALAGKLAELSSLEVVPIILFVLSIVIAGLYELTVSRRLQARLIPVATT